MSKDRRIFDAIMVRIDNSNHLEFKLFEDAFSALRNIANEAGYKDMELSNTLKTRIRSAMKSSPYIASDLYALYWRVMCWEATDCFDSFVLYMEHNRDRSKQFYLPRRKQLKPLADALQDLEDRKLELLAISLPPGVGKALADDTPVLTRSGWKNHGDLAVGDEVIGMDGRFKRVIAVHDKCMLDVLVEFTNGEKIQCHENHEWMVFDRPIHDKAKKVYIAETKRLEKRTLASGGEQGHRGHRYSIQLPKRSCVVGEQKDLPLDPYTFGVWLGDGANKNPRICCSERDKCIIDRIVDNGVPMKWSTIHKETGVLYFEFDIRKELRTMGLCHSRKRNPKYIPDCYLTASIQQRLELLAGLIDTDGCRCGSKYQFTTAEELLRDTFIELISTFGWRASVQVKHPTVSSSGIKSSRDHYVISFTPDIYVPCELERKRISDIHQQRAIGFKKISRVEPKQGNCITVEGDGMYLAGRTMVPTHNTTLAEFFLVWTAGRHPEKPILTGSHSNAFLRGLYGEIQRFLSPTGDYCWQDVFPQLKVISTNAQDMLIDIGENNRAAKRFTTFQFRSVGSANAGVVRAENLLYCDDLVDGLESAMSKERMDKLYNLYAVDLRQRKIGDCVELHIATRWSVHDVIGHLEQMYGGSDKARFISVPALDENDESNFDYPIEAGFTTEFYHDQREAMDDVSWRALYMNQPIEREGLLYSEQALRRYFELPDSEPDAILSVCDTKDKGSDYCVMPIVYQYGNDFYVEDVICDNSNPDIVDDRLISILLKHKVHLSQFESNSAGGRIAEKVQNAVKDRGGRTKILTKFTTANKDTKIVVNQPWVLEHCIFKDASKIKENKEYRTFLNFLCSYTMAGKNKYDDVPDAMAMLAEYCQGMLLGKAEIMARPW